MKTPKIVLLHSVDGPGYTKALLLGESIVDKSSDEINDLISDALENGQTDGGAEWNFDDVSPHLQAAGFIVPEAEQVLTGPNWDA